MGEFSWDKVPVLDGSSPNPAAGAASVTVYTCPAGKRARFLSVSGLYSRDANAANVLGVLTHDDGTNFFGKWPLAAYMTASTTWNTSWAQHAIGSSVGDYVTGSIPCLELRAGDTVKIYWVSKQAGDDGAIHYFTYQEAPE